MTKKDYQAIADVIVNRLYGATPTRRFALSDVAKDLCAVFEEDNPRFDRDKFLIACGVK